MSTTLTADELREQAYEAYCAGDWRTMRRRYAMAKKLDAQRAFQRACAVHGEYSKAGLEAYRAYRTATAISLKMDVAA
jgi:hypothetical protein